MNNEINEVDVELITDNEQELLKFNFHEEISIDLTSDDPQQLKTFFLNLLKNIENTNMTLKFIESTRTDLIYDVAKSYVEHLNNEITSICAQKLNVIELNESTETSENDQTSSIELEEKIE